MPKYAKFGKEIISNKKWDNHDMVIWTKVFSIIFQKKLLSKLKNLGRFTIPCTIDNYFFNKPLCDLGASVNLIYFFICKKLELGEVKSTTVSLQLADKSIKHPRCLIEDVLVKVDNFILPVDFIVLDIEKDEKISLIIRRPFLIKMES